MNVNAGLIGLQVQGLLRDFPEAFAGNANKAFAAHCMQHLLGLSKEETLEYLTGGAGTTGIDGCFLDGVRNGVFSVVLFHVLSRRRSSKAIPCFRRQCLRKPAVQWSVS